MRIRHNRNHKGIGYKFIFIPYGIIVNQHFLTLKKGSNLHFMDGLVGKFISYAKMPTNGALFNEMCKLLYNRTSEQILDLWDRNYGGREQFDPQFCLMIFYEDK